MNNFNNGEKGETALGVLEDQEKKTSDVANEEAPVFNRGGRKGRSNAAQLGGDAKSSPQPEDANENHRLTISKEAEVALSAAVEKINYGFHGGKANRNQVAVWALIRFGEKLDAEQIREIRAEYMDEFSALDSILRRAKTSGKLPSELRAFLQKELGLDEAPKKKSKKGLQDNVINDDIEEVA